MAENSIKNMHSKHFPKPDKDMSSDEEQNRIIRIAVYLFIVLVVCLAAGGDFVEQRMPEEVFLDHNYLPKIKRLSDYLPSLHGTRGDVEIYIFRGGEPGGKVLVLGGTHPNEPASNVTSVLLAENLRVEQGTVAVILRANNSGFTATEPQEGHPQNFTIKARSGRQRQFRVGSRFTNILDGWPDPTVYEHHPSRQILSGNETRNLNRSYPGRPNGTLTERVAWAICEFIRSDSMDVVIDLHEAAPEYPVINAIVAHERAMDVASTALLEIQMDAMMQMIEGLDFNLEPSPLSFHGLSHREIGDATPARAILMESAGALQGRLRGVTNADMVTKSVDPLYHWASELGRLYVDFPEEGIPLEVRVGRHLEGIKKICMALSLLEPDRTVSYDGIPGFLDIQAHGVGYYLK
ncbi:MAG: succinylglutamate desuccinylase/aspartoacylase family protein [Candidatus Electryoneaceae bacterium]|nr:succinylglutamate desuccinylase/aspartoacylase family protein [Candidatus Electryoneaceae bacterium]